MKKPEIVSIFTVTDYKTGQEQQVEVEGAGQATVRALRKEFPRHTKFVLDGFLVDGDFCPADFRTFNRYSTW